MTKSLIVSILNGIISFIIYQPDKFKNGLKDVQFFPAIIIFISSLVVFYLIHLVEQQVEKRKDNIKTS